MKAFERATQLSEKSFGPDHVETANALTGLGARYRENGNHAEAQRCLRRALEIHRKTVGRRFARRHAGSVSSRLVARGIGRHGRRRLAI